ncbi:MAG: TetR/AcrR family transcriptional regulator [Marinicella sp.]|nr:TetR/AcrR family transcriptional regulator [Xanthomonadales bacterium]
MTNDNNSQLAWLKKGIQTLDTKGWRALKINELCQELNVTKGSFYHWFKSKRDFEIQVLQYWKQRFTQGFIDQAEQGRSSREKLSLLGKQCIDGAINGNRLEFEINAWSFQDDEVKLFVTSVYEQRYQYLTKLLDHIYEDPILVKKHALILYSLVTGVDLFYRQLTKQELELIFSDYLIESHTS